jgi:hypothetical protein
VAHDFYPNTVPENNLRLPDALTIEHGPAALLARFVLEGDKLARHCGVKLRVRHDYEALNRLNREQSALGNWYPLVDMFNPAKTDVRPDNAFWISGENDDGEIVTTSAARIYDWHGTTLERQAVTMLYGRDEGQSCIITTPAAKEITGVVLSAGGTWVRPDYRRRQLSHLLPRLARAYGLSRWPLDWVIGYVTKLLVSKGIAAGYGAKHFGYSVEYPDLPFGELVLTYTSGQETADDLETYLATELLEGLSTPSFSTILAQEVTKTSSDDARQGSSSRS